MPLPENDGANLHLDTVQALNSATEEFREDVLAQARIDCRSRTGARVVSDGDIRDAASQLRAKKHRAPVWRMALGYALEIVGLSAAAFGLQLVLGIDVFSSADATKTANVAASALATLSLNGSKFANVFGSFALVVGGLCALAGFVIKEK